MTLFLLGPSVTDDSKSDPLDARRELAHRIRATGGRALVMEDEPDREGENNFAKFQRLIKEHPPVTFLVLVPLKARLHGLSVEIGYLLTRIQEGALAAGTVHVALQHLLGGLDGDGVLALHEPGNRSRYYADLIDEGCPVHRWTDWAELNRHVVAVAIEDETRQ